jgi:hypothetical protein
MKEWKKLLEPVFVSDDKDEKDEKEALVMEFYCS